MEHQIFRTDFFKLRVLYVNEHNIRQNKMFATKNIVN